jgi:hypothetical protein
MIDNAARLEIWRRMGRIEAISLQIDDNSLEESPELTAAIIDLGKLLGTDFSERRIKSGDGLVTWDIRSLIVELNGLLSEAVPVLN